MNRGLERSLPAKCGSSAPRSHRRKAVLSPVALTLPIGRAAFWRRLDGLVMRHLAA